MTWTEGSRERWTAGAAIVSAIVAILVALFSYFQLKASTRAVDVADQARKDANRTAEIQRQDAQAAFGKQREDSNAALLAQSKFADRAAELARRSADVAIAANKIAANATTLSERAWLSVSVGEQTGNFAIAMRNTGKSPALNVAYLATFKAGKRGVIPDADLRINPEAPTIPPDAPKEMLDILRKEGYIKEHAPTGFVIAPGDIQIASSYGGKFSQIFSLTGDRTYIQGRITYDDIFGKAHETVFCYWFEQPSTFVMCNDHNKMN